jgi:hypothetical protein
LQPRTGTAAAIPHPKIDAKLFVFLKHCALCSLQRFAEASLDVICQIEKAVGF